MLLGLVADYKRIGPRGPVAYTWHFFQFACLALVIAGFTMVARHFDAPPPRWGNPTPQLQELRGGAETVETFVGAVNEGNVALLAFFQGDAARLPEARKKLEQTPSLDAQADLLREDLKTLVARAHDLGADASLAPDERGERHAQLAADHAAWQERLQKWVETGGRDYALTLRDAAEGEEK
jgi:hypothetical protein